MRQTIKKVVNATPGLRQLNAIRVDFKIRNIERRAKEALHKNGHAIVTKIPELLEEAGVEAWIGFGTLLGFVREGDFIAHDCDIDFAFLCTNESEWNAVEEVLQRNGFTKKQEFGNRGCVTEQTYVLGNLKFDLFGLRPVDNNNGRAFFYSAMQDSNTGDSVVCSIMQVDLPLPHSVIKWEISGMQLSMPDNYLKWLETLYGKDWRIPDPTYRHEHYWKTVTNERGFGRFF